jgi:parallel beta-helix repeat protein
MPKHRLIASSVAVAVAMVSALIWSAPPARAATTKFSIDCTQAVGFDITSSGTYLLRRAVSDCASATAAIRVSVSDVVVDLQDRAVDGNDAGSFGILTVAATTNVTIRNGTVSDFDDGIRLDGGASKVTGLTVRSSDDDGIQVAAGNKVTENTVSRNVFGINAGDGTTVSRNTVSGNGVEGIIAGSGSAVSRNRVSGNGNFGIVTGNGSTVSRNRVSGNSGFGISVGNGSTVSRNRVSGNGLTGIVTGSGSTVAENRATGNGNDGIRVVADSKVVGNKANGNLDDGIEITAPSETTKVKDNSANGNVDWGIDAGAGPVSGGKTNKAKDNGQAAQCRPAGVCI